MAGQAHRRSSALMMRRRMELCSEDVLQIIHAQLKIIQNTLDQSHSEIFVTMQRHDGSMQLIGTLDEDVAAFLPDGDVVVLQQSAQELLPGNDRRFVHAIRDVLPFARQQ